MYDPQCIALDCSNPDRPIGMVTGPMRILDRLCMDLNRHNPAARNKPPRFQYSALLSPTDCRQDLLARQAIWLAEAERNAPSLANPLAMAVASIEPEQLSLF